VANTLCSLAGLPLMETVDGKDISGLLAGESGEVHKIGVTEFAWSKSVRKGDWRLVYYPPEMFAEEYPDGFGELYNLADDPWEMTNLYFEAAHAGKVRELERDLTDWLVRTTRPKTFLGDPCYESDQAVTRYKHTVNFDGKTHPDRVGQARTRNYI
jgi:arylsulfatase A-like enzyme